MYSLNPKIHAQASKMNPDSSQYQVHPILDSAELLQKAGQAEKQTTQLLSFTRMLNQSIENKQEINDYQMREKMANGSTNNERRRRHARRRTRHPS